MKAIIDLGSNSVKILIARQSQGEFISDFHKSWITRLGKGLSQTENLNPESVSKTQQALLEMKQIINNHPIEETYIVGTAALRKCKNPELISDFVKKTFQQELQIISGQKEAQLSLAGASQASKKCFPDSECFFIDLGGASTEVCYLENKKFHGHSFNLGAVSVHETLNLQLIPVKDDAWENAQKNILNLIDASQIQLLKENMNPTRQAVGIGGTLVNAAMATKSKKMDDYGFLCSRTELEIFTDDYRKKTLKERLLFNVEEGRADILPAGLLLLTTLLKIFNREKCFITHWGLRHGIFYNPELLNE